MLKDPYILEFLGLEERPAYSERDLESAVIGKLQHFLLEFGKGFLFQARQKRFTFDEDHFFVDLAFYNRLLRCYVLVDLKPDKLTHQELGLLPKIGQEETDFDTPENWKWVRLGQIVKLWSGYAVRSSDSKQRGAFLSFE